VTEAGRGALSPCPRVTVEILLNVGIAPRDEGSVVEAQPLLVRQRAGTPHNDEEPPGNEKVTGHSSGLIDAFPHCTEPQGHWPCTRGSALSTDLFPLITPRLLKPVPYTMAIGRTGQPVAPRNLVASRMKQKLFTPSRASSSRIRFSIR